MNLIGSLLLIKIFKQPKNHAWIKLRKNNPKLMVHFEVESIKSEVLLPIEFPDHNAIPCRSIVINNPTVQVC